MLSGGLDSAACLFKLLDETDDDVHTFYVELENNSDKVWCEKESIKELQRVAKNKVRTFTHHTGSSFYIRGTPTERGIQPFLWMTASASTLNYIDGARKRLCIGYTAGDTATDAIEELKGHWKYMWSLYGNGKMPPLYLPLLKRTKAQSMDYLRRLEHKKEIEIVNHLWTCEGPVRFHGPNGSGYKACKTCLPCKRGLEIGLVQP
jgi:7-cyano-7-deazaguanine synthase in queuosine biosynthesis